MELVNEVLVGAFFVGAIGIFAVFILITTDPPRSLKKEWELDLRKLEKKDETRT